MRRVAAIIAGLLLLLLPVAPASAHAQLVSMTPAADSTVTVAPHRVVLRFGETMQPLGSDVVVLDPSGGQVQTDELRVRGRTITVGLNRLTASGTYRVNYRILSSDGHVVSDSRAFTFRPGTIPPPASPAKTVASPGDADAPASGPTWPPFVVGLLLLGCVAVGIAALRRR